MPLIAEKYEADPKKFKAIDDGGKSFNQHNTRLCGKLAKFKWESTNGINFEHLKTKLALDVEEIYEIGATALDLSILLTFKKTDDSSGQASTYVFLFEIQTKAVALLLLFRSDVVQANSEKFQVEASVLDLDPKQCSKHFLNFIKTTRGSYNAYKKYKSSK